MKVRKYVFTALAWLAGAWMVLGFVLNATYSAPVPDSTAGQLGRATGDVLTVTFTVCTGLPFLLLFSVLAWRNAVGIREKKRHEELIQATRHE